MELLENKENPVKKYELTDETFDYYGTTLHRIKALIDIPGRAYAGELGGLIESEDNLAHDGYCWVGYSAKVFDNARVKDHAYVDGRACISQDAMVIGQSTVCGSAKVQGSAIVSGRARIYGNAYVSGNAKVYDNALLFANVGLSGFANVHGNVVVGSNSGHHVHVDAEVMDGFISESSNIMSVGPVKGIYRITLNKVTGTICVEDTYCNFDCNIDGFEKYMNETPGSDEECRAIVDLFKTALCKHSEN